MAYKEKSPIPVVEGGTGIQAAGAAYAPICGGTTTTGALQTASSGIGTSGFVLTSTGSSSLPTWQNISADGAITSFTTDSGGVTPSMGSVDLAGGSNLNTSGSGSTATFNLDNTVSISGSMTAGTGLTATTGNVTATAGNVVITAGNLTLPNTNSAGTHGVIQIGGVPFISNFGTNNTFIGASTGNTSVTGAANIGIGFANSTGALAALTSGFDNVCIGGGAAITSGLENTIVGSYAGIAITDSAGNIVLGCASFQNCNGSNNVIVGSGIANEYMGTETFNVIISSEPILGDNNILRIGHVANANKIAATYIAGIDGINVGSTAQVVTESGNQLGTAVITAGPGISIGTSANAITISAVDAATSWTVVTASTQALSINAGYVANYAGLCTMTLPATAAVGSIIEVTNLNTAMGWQIAQNASQYINLGSATTTTGTGGYLASTALGDSVRILCVVANNGWQVLSVIGNITVH